PPAPSLNRAPTPTSRHSHRLAGQRSPPLAPAFRSASQRGAYGVRIHSVASVDRVTLPDSFGASATSRVDRMPVPRTHLLARPRTIQRACGWFDGCTWSPATDVPERGSGRLEEVEMGQRLKTLGFASLLTLLAALPVARS